MVDFKKLYTIFVEEAMERIADLENGLLELEQSPQDKELLNTIFRAAHTIKGSSGTIGLTDIARFTHTMEEVLDAMRHDTLVADKEVISLFLEATDLIKEMVECVASESVFDISRCSALMTRMEALREGGAGSSAILPDVPGDAAAPAGCPAQERSYLIKFIPGPDLFRRGIDPSILIDELRGLGIVAHIKAYTDAVPPLSELDPEDLYVRWDIHFKSSAAEADIRKVFEFVEEGSDIRITPLTAREAEFPFLGQMLVREGAVKPEDVENALKSQKKLGEILVEKGKITPTDLERVVEQQNHKKTESLKSSISSTIRVDLRKLDHLINIVGEMVIIHSMFQQALQDIPAAGNGAPGGNGDPGQAGSLVPALQELEVLFSQLHRVGREIQESTMSLRMLPVGEVFHRFTRLVRELSVSKNKQIELAISGEETELDKGVLEKITDPLVHLIRNAIDHGIETPEERAAAGKTPKGSIHLSAFQMGDAVFIEVADDGKGLSREKILKKAHAMGLVTDPAAAREMTDEQICSMIFLPGFSTADKVSDVSGRGVGMDVVKRNIEELNGRVLIHTKPGEGTTISVKLPLTLAIIDGLIVQIGGEPFVIPISLVVESLRPGRDDVKTLTERGEVVAVRGDYLPLIRLDRLLGITSRQERPWEAIVIITAYEGKRYGLLVDELAGQQQIVLKNLGTATPRIKDIAGGTILGNGRVALVLDVPGIIEISREISRELSRR
ncbi:MAG: chemotaxis protein CheA [Nitrospirota bacterium]